MTGRRIAVVGGGWAGLAAAVRAVQAGHHVTLFEMAQTLGGRARSVPLPGQAHGQALDNGQHILIGAYRRTLDLLRTVGGQEAELLRRMPLVLRYADGRGLVLPRGPVWVAFVRAVANCVGWTWSDRAALIRAAAGWALDRFRCDPTLTVEALCRTLPPAVRELLIDPLCVAALNTPAREASAQVMLRVLRDALFGGRGAADLLLPRRPLGELACWSMRPRRVARCGASARSPSTAWCSPSPRPRRHA
jgi:hydroxysqualene dehydroxylase